MLHLSRLLILNNVFIRDMSLLLPVYFVLMEIHYIIFYLTWEILLDNIFNELTEHDN
jgi:hypothetical protein